MIYVAREGNAGSAVKVKEMTSNELEDKSDNV